jgi:hypothetical protein
VIPSLNVSVFSCWVSDNFFTLMLEPFLVPIQNFLHSISYRTNYGRHFCKRVVRFVAAFLSVLVSPSPKLVSNG